MDIAGEAERRVTMEKKENRKKPGILYRIIMLILLGIMIFCTYKIITIICEYREGTAVYDELAEIANAVPSEDMHIDFDALKKENEDIIAWLYSEDTVINYPVVQGDDNAFYLYRLVDKTWNVKGSLFADYRCENPFEDFNTVIYGHRMNDGSMFKCLLEYRDTEGYYDDHSVMELATPEAVYDVEIFGAATIPSDSEMYKFNFSSDEEKTAYIDWVRGHNEIPSGGGSDVEVSPSDRIIMLSTCTYEFEEARLVVWGKLSEKSG